MSYCRFSSDNFKCDVYCYESAHGGFVIHVAKNRRVGATPIPELPPLLSVTPEEFREAHKRQSEWLNTAVVVPIGLPDDGETYDADTAEETANMLISLRAKGYRVPQYAIDTLLEEANENKS